MNAKTQISEIVSHRTPNRLIFVRMGAYYFLFFMTVAVFAPYFNLYLSARGLTPGEVGLVLAVPPFVGLFAQPVWGILNDRYHIERITLMTGIVAPPMGLLFMSHVHHVEWFIFINACVALFQSSVIPVADSMTVQQASPKHYGKIRMFGSLGYAILVDVAAFFYSHYGIGNILTLSLVTVVGALLGVGVYPKRSIPKGHSRLQTPFGGIGKLLKNRQFALILIFTVFGSISAAMNNNFYSLYYHALNRPLSLLGIIYSCGALSELPMLFISGKLITKFGPLRVLLFSSCVFLLRWVGLAFAPPTPVLFVLQLLHGMSFALGLAAGVSYALQISDATNRATAQTLYSMVNGTLSSIVGSSVGGFLFGSLGPQGLYICSACISGIGITGIVWTVLRKNAPILKAASS